jgi:hypothetical protein
VNNAKDPVVGTHVESNGQQVVLAPCRTRVKLVQKGVWSKGKRRRGCKENVGP